MPPILRPSTPPANDLFDLTFSPDRPAPPPTTGDDMHDVFPDTVYPAVQVGAQLDPEARLVVHVPLAPLAGTAEASQDFAVHAVVLSTYPARHDWHIEEPFFVQAAPVLGVPLIHMQEFRIHLRDLSV